MKKFLQKYKNDRGLTLVELLAVIVILAIVGTIAFVMIGKVIEHSKEDSFIADAQQMIDSAKLYEANGLVEDTDNYTVTLKELKDQGLIDNFVDPWDKEEITADDSKNTSSEVVKDAGEYKVTLISGTHKINKVMESDLRGDDARDKVKGLTNEEQNQ